MNLLKFSKPFFKRNASTILTCLGAVGVVATAVSAAQVTPKAVRTLKKKENEKGAKLTTIEVVKVSAPIYIPTVIIGASSIACIFGANVLNKRQQAALMSAYALVNDSYKRYKNKVVELYGPDANDVVRQELVRDAYEDDVYPLEDNKVLFYDTFSERYFESTLDKVYKAEYDVNRMLAKEWGVYLNEFYDKLGIDLVDYGDYLGWSTYEINEAYWYSWIEFKHTKVTLEDGLECICIDILTEPTFDFENY